MVILSKYCKESTYKLTFKMTQVARPTIFKVVETETSWDFKFSELSIPRLFETIQMNGCRDRDSSRPQKLVVVETETCRDWSKVVETETFSRVSLISGWSQSESFRHNRILTSNPKTSFTKVSPFDLLENAIEI